MLSLYKNIDFVYLKNYLYQLSVLECPIEFFICFLIESLSFSNEIYTDQLYLSIRRFSWITYKISRMVVSQGYINDLLSTKTTDAAIEKVLHVWNHIRITSAQTVKHLSLITFTFSSMFNERFQIAERRFGKVVWSCPGTHRRFADNTKSVDLIAMTTDLHRRIQMSFVIVSLKNSNDGLRKFISRDHRAFMGRFLGI